MNFLDEQSIDWFLSHKTRFSTQKILVEGHRIKGTSEFTQNDSKSMCATIRIV